jgi:hypothetical protein
LIQNVRPSTVDAVLYKQTYLNEAALLFIKLLRGCRRSELHKANFKRALIARPTLTEKQFLGDVITLQDTYIDFLQTILLGMFLESGHEMGKEPLHLLEPRELEVSALPDDENMMPGDFNTPNRSQLLKNMKFGDAALTRIQILLMSMVAPHEAALSTLRFKPQQDYTVDLTRTRQHILDEVRKSKENMNDKYLRALLDGSTAKNMLESMGGEAAIKEMTLMAYDELNDPKGVPKALKGRNSLIDSPVDIERQLSTRGRNSTTSALGALTAEQKNDIRQLVQRIKAEYERKGGRTSMLDILDGMNLPNNNIKRIILLR